ncbi:hypothetical protein BKA69DRAFT_1104502 [Paraphysoderma sedebokerense]|nr:hypothetical protein BKA69DRAFT_1104502 [Paraphysoderma sedebokerense]
MSQSDSIAKNELSITDEPGSSSTVALESSKSSASTTTDGKFKSHSEKDQRIKSVCVFCGSRVGASPEYVQAAKDLAKAFVDRGITLVYGGGAVGVMGALASTVDKLGGKVIGIIPEALVAYSGVLIGETVIVPDMHTRKALMNEKADAFIALPGGFGTMEELLEVTTWSQLNIHHKPVLAINIRNYYSHLKLWIENAVKEEFVSPVHQKLIRIEDSVESTISALEKWERPKEGLWDFVWKKKTEQERTELI